MRVAESSYQEYRAALLAGDHRTCAGLLERLLEGGTSPRTVHIELFQRSMYDVGDLWERNLVSVATEHVASAITESLLNLLLLRVPLPRRSGQTIVVAAIAPELHQVGAKIVADTFELRGWDSLFIGGNTPASDLLRYVREIPPDLIALSLTMYFNLAELERAIEVLREQRPKQRILIGGQGLRNRGPDLARRFQVSYIENIDELADYFTDE